VRDPERCHLLYGGAKKGHHEAGEEQEHAVAVRVNRRHSDHSHLPKHLRINSIPLPLSNHHHQLPQKRVSDAIFFANPAHSVNTRQTPALRGLQSAKSSQMPWMLQVSTW
jgi:hypothetical protein